MTTHTSTRLLVGLLWLALWPDTARGQSATLQEAYDRFEVLYAKDHQEEALPFAQKALRLGRREFGPDHPITATLLSNLAKVHQARGDYAAAEPLQKRVLALREEALVPTHPNVAQSLENYAALLRLTERPDEADRIAARAREIWAKAQ